MNTRVLKKFSVKIFLMILLCVVAPLICLSFYITHNMEKFIQEQMSDRVIQNLSRNERNIYDNLQKLAYLSNSLIMDEEFQDRLKDAESSHYRNAVYFEHLVEKTALTIPDKTLEAAKIILFDNFGRCYSNWELNYQDYFFLLDEDWVKEARENEGYIVWSMFNPAYIIEDGEDEQYISMARTVPDIYGNQIGTLIISINRSEFSSLVTEYAYEGDVVFLCIDEGLILMDNDREESIEDKTIKELFDGTREEKSGRIKQAIERKEYLINYYTLKKPWQFNGQDIKIFHFTDYGEIQKQISEITGKIEIVILIVLGLILAILAAAVRLVVRPITILTKQMNTYTIDTEIQNVDLKRGDEIGDLNRAFSKMSRNLKDAFRRVKEETEIKEQYRYESMRAQINPHFLFNTLTSIRWMAVIRGADNIVESIDELAHLLKYSFGRDKERVSIREELKNIQSYVYIQNLRYGNHVKLDIDVEDEIQSMETMKFILQPIVENAVIHGYDNKQQKPLHIYIYGDVEEGHLNLYVEDDGVGISQNVIEQFQNSKMSLRKESKMTGIGLYNVDECIRITFGEEYGLHLQQNDGNGTVVQFVLPILIGREEGGAGLEKTDDCG